MPSTPPGTRSRAVAMPAFSSRSASLSFAMPAFSSRSTSSISSGVTSRARVSVILDLHITIPIPQRLQKSDFVNVLREHVYVAEVLTKPVVDENASDGPGLGACHSLQAALVLPRLRLIGEPPELGGRLS